MRCGSHDDSSSRWIHIFSMSTHFAPLDSMCCGSINSTPCRYTPSLGLLLGLTRAANTHLGSVHPLVAWKPPGILGFTWLGSMPGSTPGPCIPDAPLPSSYPLPLTTRASVRDGPLGPSKLLYGPLLPIWSVVTAALGRFAANGPGIKGWALQI